MDKKVKNQQVYYIQTEGVNFGIIKDLDFVDQNKVSSNDIHAISQKLGVIFFLFRLKQPVLR